MLLFLTTAYYGTAMWQRVHTNVPAFAWSLTPLADAMRWTAGRPTVYSSSAPAGAAAAAAGASSSSSIGTYLSSWLADMGGAEASSSARGLTNLEVLLSVMVVAGLVTAGSQTVNVVRFELRKGGWPAARRALGAYKARICVW
jgi:hypothetical protein